MKRTCTYPNECECQPFKGCLKPMILNDEVYISILQIMESNIAEPNLYGCAKKIADLFEFKIRDKEKMLMDIWIYMHQRQLPEDNFNEIWGIFNDAGYTWEED